MAFTTWAAMETKLLDAWEDHLTNGSPITASYTGPSGVRHDIRSADDLTKLLDYVAKRKNMETAGTPSTRVSYGRHRRFR